MTWFRFLSFRQLNVGTGAAKRFLTPFLIFVSFSSIPTFAASFDCKKAVTRAETLICADPDLSKLDSRLAEAFRKVLSTATGQDAVRREQHAWLAVRDACLGQTCLKTEYESRLAELEKYLRDSRKKRSTVVSGKYVCDIPHDEGGDHKVTERFNLSLEIEKNLVKQFSSSWVFASDHPDLRPGYATTCHIELKDLEQIRRAEGIFLKLRPGHHQGYQENCELKIVSTPPTLHVSSVGCVYECLAIDVVINQGAGTCRRTN